MTQFRPRMRTLCAAVLAFCSVDCGGSQPAATAPAPASGAASQALPPPDRSQLPEPGPPPSWAPPTPASWRLQSGAEVLYRNHGSVPLVSVIVVLPRGSETDPPGKAGLTTLMADLLDEGAGGKNALQLNERLQTLATDFAASVSVDATLLAMSMIEENFEASLDLLGDIVRRPHFEQEEFTRRKAQLIAQALAAEADPHSARRVAMYRALFGTGYAGSVPSGTRDTLESITYADVKAHHARIVAAEQATFIVVGGIAQAKVNQNLERVFGDWRGASSATALPLTASAAVGKLHFIDYPGAAQSVIGLVRRAPGADAPDLFPATVFNRSFGEAFTSRVNMNLRESKGYTYGAVSTFQRFRQAGFFGVFSDVRADVTRASLDELLKELDELCGARPITAEERDASVNGLLLGYPATFESIGLLASRYTQLPLYGRPLNWFETWPRQLEAVTHEEAGAAARRYCSRSEFVAIVAGDKAKVAPTLDGIGFGWLELDARGRPK